MAHVNTVFHAVQQFLPRHVFKSLESQMFESSETRSLSNWSYFTFLLFAQLVEAKSLREALTFWNCRKEKGYHVGVTSNICRSTISDANAKRSHIFFQRLFEVLQSNLIKQLNKKLKFPFKIIDSTTISTHNKIAGNLKLHVVIDAISSVPLSIDMTSDRIADITIAKNKEYNPGDLILQDRGYFSSEEFEKLNKNGVFFVVRAKSNLKLYTQSSKRYKEGNIREDAIVNFVSEECAHNYSESIRKITIFDSTKNQAFDVLTNHKEIPAEVIAQLYKKRWKIELFFKWLKQNTKMKTLYAYSENGIKIQIWMALITYLLLYAMKERYKQKNLLELRRKVKFQIFQPINNILGRPKNKEHPKNLNLFNLTGH